MLDSARLQLKPRHLALLRELLERYTPAADVWAFGSRVSGGAHECSDLDLVVRNPGDLSADTEGWMELKEAFQESRLPMLVEVHDWAHLPPAFQREIERAYVVVQAGDALCGSAHLARTKLDEAITVNREELGNGG